MNDCKKCLLLAAGENAAYNTVSDYLANLDDNLKVSGGVYKKRLAFCTQCDNLLSGMCVKCGCYVEVRAALKDKSCADCSKNFW